MAITWTETRPNGDADYTWRCGASDDDGSVLIVCHWGGHVYYTVNGGTNWTETNVIGSDENKNWIAVDTDADGSVMVAGAYGGRLWKSVNSGTSWTEMRPDGDANKNWRLLKISKTNGSVMLAGYGDSGAGKCFVSTDTGANWSEVTPAGAGTFWWYSGCMDDDGSVMVAPVYGGKCYISTNTGSSWSEITPTGTSENKNWVWCDCSSDGSKIWIGINANGSPIYLSTNTGTSFASKLTESGQAPALCECNSDGTRCLASMFQQHFYTTANSGTNWTEKTDISAEGAGAFRGAVDSDGSNLFLCAYEYGAGYNGRCWIGIDDSVSSGGTKTQINIGDTWKTATALQINIGDVWKPVTHVQQNIGDTWKTVF